MSGTTTNFGWPYPTGTDAPPDVASDMQSLASAADASVGNAWTETYAPEWTSSGVAPVLNDGTFPGRAKKLGKTGIFEAKLTLGAGSTIGTGFYRFSLPAGWTVLTNQIEVGHGSFFDTSTGITYTGSLWVISVGPSSARMTLHTHAAATEVSATVPVTPAAGDIIRLTGVVELA